MTWEWERGSQGGQWVVIVGGWRATVAGSRTLWQATLERTRAPHDRYESPTYIEAVDARSWCLRKIAELADTT
jgi:hypothetical protein